jgi:RNA polymerase sigma factor (sigma-70 family)
MERQQAAQEMDALLLPYLEAADQSQAEVSLAGLISDVAEPVIRAILRKKLRAHFNSDSQGVEDQEAEDVRSNALVGLIARLRQLKQSPRDNPISNFKSYVAVITYHACYEHFRQKYPQRHGLKNRLRYLLTHNDGLAIWEGADRELVCGLASWKEMGAGGASAQAAAPGKAEWEKNPTKFLIAIFQRAGAPVELDELVSLVAQAAGIKDGVENLDCGGRHVGSASEPAEARQDDFAGELDRRVYLERLWQQIRELPVRQRAALLLNLKDSQGGPIISLFPLTGIATIRDIADVLEIPAKEFARLWNELPMGDSAIAERLGLTRQQVINLRKSARERLIRRMRALSM